MRWPATAAVMRPDLPQVDVDHVTWLRFGDRFLDPRINVSIGSQRVNFITGLEGVEALVRARRDFGADLAFSDRGRSDHNQQSRQ